MRIPEEQALWESDHVQNYLSMSIWHGPECDICDGRSDGPVVKRYVHPQGGTIEVYASGRLSAWNAAGKKKKTSATAEKLAVGHGRWEEVSVS